MGEIGALNWPPDVCPKRPYWVQCVERPDLRYPQSCDAYWCRVCGPRKAMQAAAAMTWAMRHADRSRLVTLTLAPEDWQQRRQKARDFRRYLVRRGYRWEWSWTTERNPRGTGFHVHAVQHGDRVPQALLQDVWGAIAHVTAVKQDRTAAAQYTVKEALRVAGYTVKRGTASAAGLAEHLDLNGGRAAHWSRGFLHGMTKREALADVRRELANGEPLTWVLVPVWDPHTSAGCRTVETGEWNTSRSRPAPAASESSSGGVTDGSC